MGKLDPDEKIDVLYRGSQVKGTSSILVSLEFDDLDEPQKAIKLLETRFSLGERVTMIDVLAVWLYIRAENEKRRREEEFGGQSE